ncbi:NADPH-dependent F420 reductase [Pontibacter fetidus]|uniref:NAD(P)-binding domain-containing protein n=1 Tax=Pontibacter fetidus TaxID=2700082 RepID=A0A6B2HB87_9BACT|nr:NAD(P)-binding domain-containing protein [Pontibacter fetidus]NDK56834.1 NAD(P)-binding domain-containing protein [Pontibacter fetidus]
MKNIAVLGTGMVGNTIGTKLTQLGYNVMMGSRSATNQKALAWAEANGANASAGTFEDAAKFGEIIFNCTKGEIALDVFKMAGTENFNGKTIIDISNPLDFSKGMPPSLIPELSNTNSLGEEIQKLLPEANVVKTLNIVNCEVMVDAKKSGGDPTMFMSGNSAEAKEEAKAILEQFGWNDIIDLGDITTARGTEMLLPIWLRTWMATGNGYFAFKIVR